MKKISFVVAKDYQQNRIFDLSNSTLNRDNCLYPYNLFKNELKKRGFDISTNDILSYQEADIVIYNEMPKDFPKNIEKEKSYLLLFETELIHKENWDFKKHEFFKKIFTWNDKFVDGVKYFKFNFPNEIQTTPVGLEGRDGFLISISANKTNTHTLELYSKRVETIRWFEKNHPEKLDYYGIGWDYAFDIRWQKLFRKLKILSVFPKHVSTSSKGKVDKKIATMRKYKFAICYENARDIDGYITEKIFDCLFAGTIPVYWGANNITKYVPENCFIDRRLFHSHEELYEFLKNLSDEDILNYQRNIHNYLQSEQMKFFSNEFFVKNLIENIIDE